MQRPQEETRKYQIMGKVIHIGQWQERILVWRREHLREGLEGLTRKNKVIRVKARKSHWNLTFVCLTPDGMEAYVTVDSCPEEPRKWMKSNEEENYDFYDSDMDVVRFDGDSAPPFIQIRSVAKKHPKTWVHYIAAEEDDWDYAPSVLTSNDRQVPFDSWCYLFPIIKNSSQLFKTTNP